MVGSGMSLHLPYMLIVRFSLPLLAFLLDVNFQILRYLLNRLVFPVPVVAALLGFVFLIFVLVIVPNAVILLSLLAKIGLHTTSIVKEVLLCFVFSVVTLAITQGSFSITGSTILGLHASLASRQTREPLVAFFSTAALSAAALLVVPLLDMLDTRLRWSPLKRMRGDICSEGITICDWRSSMSESARSSESPHAEEIPQSLEDFDSETPQRVIRAVDV